LSRAGLLVTLVLACLAISALAAEKQIGKTCSSDANATDGDTIAQCSSGTFVRATPFLAAQIGAREGQKVSVVADGGRLIIEPAAETWRLEDLLVGMTPEAMGEAFEWGG
jgi:antitoxin MazE